MINLDVEINEKQIDYRNDKEKSYKVNNPNNDSICFESYPIKNKINVSYFQFFPIKANISEINTF